MGQNLAAQTVLLAAGGVGYELADKLGNVMTISRTTSKVAVAASQTKAVLGATGAVGDTLSRLVIVPTTTSPGAVTLYDGSGSTGLILFNGGATSVADLKPIVLNIDSEALTAATPGWYVTTGANVAVVAFGNFT